MNTQNRTAAVVVTYNRKELLRQSLTAILNQEEYGADIIIIDNASSEIQVRILEEPADFSMV